MTHNYISSIPLISRITWIDVGMTDRERSVSPVHWNLEKTTEWVSRKRIMGWRVAVSFRLRVRSLARSLANRASVSVVIIAAWLNLTAARYDDKRPAPSRNTGHRCSPNGLRISPSAFTASWLWHVGRVCKQASEHRIHTPYHVFQAP